MDVSIIIINFNTDELTLQAVQSVFLYTKDIEFEIIVVDNNSKETRLGKELATYSNTFFYSLHTNVGFGNANNYGFSKSSGDYIFLLNSDAYLIQDNTLEILRDYLIKHDNVACVGANLINEEGEPDISFGNFLTIKRMLYNYGVFKCSQEYFQEYLATSKYCNFANPTDVPYLSGASLFIKKSYISKYGLFDTRYFMYFEDMDFCFKVHKNGFSCVILPSVKIVHLIGSSKKNKPEISYMLEKHINHSKYLFLINITNVYFAKILIYYGWFFTVFKKIT